MSIVGSDSGEEKKRRGGREGKERERVWEGPRLKQEGRRERAKERKGGWGRGEAGSIPHHALLRVTDWRKRRMGLCDSTGIQRTFKKTFGLGGKRISKRMFHSTGAPLTQWKRFALFQSS